jgi:hypothetical protein
MLNRPYLNRRFIKMKSIFKDNKICRFFKENSNYSLIYLVL